MIEVKYRGPLSENQLLQLRRYLKKRGKLVNANNEKVVYFETSIFPQIGDFMTGFSRLSLKSTPSGSVFRIKQGNPSDSERKEKAVRIRKKDCPNLLYILDQLGLKYGYFRPAYREDFLLSKFTVSIKTKCVMGNHFEVDLKQGISVDDPIVQGVLKACKLNFWTMEKYQKKINANIKRVPAIAVYESKLWE
ncbi:MAG: hypothetical protein ABIN01_03780 [Ferruginibacter sp.]